MIPDIKPNFSQEITNILFLNPSQVPGYSKFKQYLPVDHRQQGLGWQATAKMQPQAVCTAQELTMVLTFLKEKENNNM